MVLTRVMVLIHVILLTCVMVLVHVMVLACVMEEPKTSSVE